MDKSSDAREASSSKKLSNTTALHSSQFVWQIKGEYHLKCSDNENSPENNSAEVKTNNVPDLPTMDENTSDSEHISPVQAALVAQGPQAARDDDHDNDQLMSQVKQKSRRDLQLLKWQTRQVAKAFVDNTINCVLEDMGFGPLTVETEDIISDGNLEHEAVSMAILSHGLQRSVHDTCTTSSHVNSSNSQPAYKSNSSRLQFLDGLSSDTKVRTAYDTISSNSQMGASSSSSKAVYQNGGMVLDVLPKTETSQDRIIISAENIMTAEHSKPHCVDALHLQSPSNSLHCDGIFTQAHADCDVLSCLGVEAHDKLPTEPCTCSLSHKLASPQGDSLSSSFHKRKAEDLGGISKRCCQNSSSSPLESAHNHDESVSNVQILYDKVPSFEHFDFMDAAVAVAIQKKGLSAMACTEYG